MSRNILPNQHILELLENGEVSDIDMSDEEDEFPNQELDELLEQFEGNELEVEFENDIINTDIPPINDTFPVITPKKKKYKMDTTPF